MFYIVTNKITGIEWGENTKLNTDGKNMNLTIFYINNNTQEKKESNHCEFFNTVLY